ncbi:MAG: DUF2723 domain-containing protein, partial [Anaerolineae bacterium]|nr:DUF2723 domain-containing protein [Anaerolineae bacterium]
MLTFKRVVVAAVVLVILGVYFSTLQTIPNGASDPYMIDVGETQVALNVWGTLHATGYPLYTILGNLLTPVPQLFSVNPAAAASLVSIFWSLLALSGFYLLLYRFTGNPLLAVTGTALLALMRSIWIHSVIAEVYSFSLVIVIGLWLITLADSPLRHRLWGLALLFGIGVAHHRAVAFGAGGLIFVLAPRLYAERHQLPRLLPSMVLLFLAGFLPYLYLPLRANANAEWVYAEDVNTWDGFWFNFWGREAEYLVTMPENLQGWIDNLEGTLGILSREMTPVGVGIAFAALILAGLFSPHRKLYWMTVFSGLGFFIFALSYHRAVLPEAILMMLLPSVVVWVVLVVDRLFSRQQSYGLVGVVFLLVWTVMLFPNSHSFIQNLTEDETGLNSIRAANSVPRIPLEQPILMLSWGPRFFAASYSRLVTGENADLPMVDHNTDFSRLAAEGKIIYTEPDTLYGYPVSWWEQQLGRVYLTAAAPNLVRLGTEPRRVELDTETLEKPIEAGIWLAGTTITCEKDQIILAVGWYAAEQPNRDFSVKVHLTRADSPVPLFQADKNAPVFGWRPTSTWVEGELIQDFYRLPRLPEGKQIILGLYEQLPDGSFANYGDTVLPVSCTTAT